MIRHCVAFSARLYQNMDMLKIKINYLSFRFSCILYLMSVCLGQNDDNSDSKMFRAVIMNLESFRGQFREYVLTQADIVSDLQDTISGLQSKVAELESSTDTTNTINDIKDRLATVENYEHSINALHQRLDTFNDSLKTTTEQIASTESSLGTVSSRVQSIESKLETLGNSVNNSDTTLAAIGTRLTVIEDKTNGFDAQLQLMETNIQNVNSRVETSDDNLNTINSRLQPIETILENMDRKFDSSDTTLATLATRVAATENRTEVLDSKIQLIETNVQNVDQRVETTESTLQTLGDKFVTFENATDALQNRLHSAENATDALENRYNTTKITIETIDNRLESTESTVDFIATKLDTTESAVQSFINRIDLTNVSVTLINETLQELVRNNETLNDHINSTNVLLESNEDLLCTLEERVDQIETIANSTKLDMNSFNAATTETLDLHASLINETKGDIKLNQVVINNINETVESGTANTLATIQQMDGRINQLENVTGTAYTFFVMNSTSDSQQSVSPNPGEDLKFDTIKTAIGGGYNATEGKYVIPASGNYVFTFSVVVIEGIVAIKLKDNDGTIVEQIGKSVGGSFEVVTGTVVISRSAGTGVYLHVERLGSVGIIMIDKCWLAGWLLQLNDPEIEP